MLSQQETEELLVERTKQLKSLTEEKNEMLTELVYLRERINRLLEKHGVPS